MKKLLSVLLCLVLLLALLPTAALAVTTYNLGNPLTLRLNREFYGSLPEGETPWGAGDFENCSYSFTKNDFAMQAIWSLGGSPLPEGAKFLAGYTYELRLVFDSNAGSYSAIFENDGWGVSLDGTPFFAAPTITSEHHAEAVFTFTCASVIKELDITGIEIPRAGAAMQTKGFHFGPGANLTLKGVQWYRTSKTDVPIPVSGSFEANTNYRLELTVGAPANRMFQLTKANVAAELGKVYSVVQNSGTEVVVNIDFSVIATDKVSSVSVGIKAPEAGAKPSFLATVGGAGYRVNEANYDGNYIAGIAWYEGTEMEPMVKLSEFKAGKTYTVIVNLVPETGYEFINSNPSGYSNAVSATLNGNAAESWGSETTLRVSYTFPALQADKTAISSVAVTAPAPASGKTPTYSASVSGAHYSVDTPWNGSNGVGWALMNSKAWDDIDKVLSASDKFETGEIYMVVVALTPDSGYAFASALTTDTSKVLVNGNAATHVETNGDGLLIYYVYPPAAAPAKPVENVALTIAKPAAGAMPTYIATVGGEHYAVDTGWTADGASNGVGWALMNSKAWNDVDRAMKPTEKFAAGEIYMVAALLAPDSGYAFASNLTTDMSKVLVNGYPASHAQMSGDGLIVYYVYPPTAVVRTLESIAVTTPPAKTEYNAGQSFDPAGMTVVATYSDKTTAKIIDYTVTPAKLAETDKFVTVSYTEDSVTKTATVAVTVKPAKTLANIAVTTPPAKTTYKAGETFQNLGMVVTATYTDLSTAAVTGYSVSPSVLAEGDKTVTVTYTEGGITKTAAVAVTVQPKEKDDNKKNPFADVFKTDYFYDAVLWAYYADPQVTNGVSGTEFAPYSTVTRGQAVTFLWRAMGCPEPGTKSNPFKDVPEGEYYYKAVLWAVEKGITKGTDDTHFTPAQTCSTAHIITFLYRTLGIGADGWGEASETWAKGAGLLDGLNVKVAPGVDCPRCDVVLFLYRAVGK